MCYNHYCFEVSIEQPSSLLARTQPYSNYKKHNTIKFLFGITPQGSVAFISKGWGGRVSNIHLTENPGLRKKHLSGDMILADGRFPIQDSAELYQEFIIYRGRESIQCCITWSKHTAFKDCIIPWILQYNSEYVRHVASPTRAR